MYVRLSLLYNMRKDDVREFDLGRLLQGHREKNVSRHVTRVALSSGKKLSDSKFVECTSLAGRQDDWLLDESRGVLKTTNHRARTCLTSLSRLPCNNVTHASNTVTTIPGKSKVRLSLNNKVPGREYLLSNF